MGLSFSPVAQAELAKEQVHSSSKTKVHKLAACLGRIRVVFECWAAAWHCIHARFEAHAEGFHSSRRNILLSCVRQAEVAPSQQSVSTDKEPMGAIILVPFL